MTAQTALLGGRAGTLCSLGVWRSLVARSVRVGEVPSSNLGTPISLTLSPAERMPGESTLAQAKARSTPDDE